MVSLDPEHAKASTLLGSLLRDGMGVAQDTDRARELLQKGRDGGDACAATGLGVRMAAAPPSNAARDRGAPGDQRQFVMSTTGTNAQAGAPPGPRPRTKMQRVIQHR